MEMMYDIRDALEESPIKRYLESDTTFEVKREIMHEIELILRPYEFRRVEHNDGWEFKLKPPYYLSSVDETRILKYCTKTEKYIYFLPKKVKSVPRLQRPAV